MRYQEALDVVVGRIVAVGIRGAAAGAGDLDLQPVRAQRQPGLGEFVDFEAWPGLAGIPAIAADDQQHLGRPQCSSQRERTEQGDKSRTAAVHGRLRMK